MDRTPATAVFLDSVEHSFLNDEEKQTLMEAAREGVTSQLWSEFNDRLISAVVRTQGSQKHYTGALDDEINRFTAAYEKEKSVLDRAHRDALAALPDSDDAGRDRLWEAYAVKIRALQAQLLEAVQRTSTTVLRDVILAVVPGPARE